MRDTRSDEPARASSKTLSVGAVDTIATDLLNLCNVLAEKAPTTSFPGIMTAVAEQAKLNALFEQLPDLVSADRDLVRRGMLCNAAL